MRTPARQKPVFKLAAAASVAAFVVAFAVSRHVTEAQVGGGDGGGEFCPETAPPTSHGGAELEGFAEERGEGVVFDDDAHQLELGKDGGHFTGDATTLRDEFNAATAADFNNNGWPDLVVGSSTGTFIRFYANRTYESPEPDWSDPSDIREPNFVREHDIEPDGGDDGPHTHLVAGDFNQDGNKDFFYYRNASSGLGHTDLAIQRIYLGNGDGTFQEPYDAASNAGDFGYMNWTSTNSVVTDWNGNGWPDILFGTKLGTSDDTGAVLVFLNDCPDEHDGQPCSTNPQFERREVMTGLDLGQRGANAVQFADFTGSGVKDLLIGSPSYDSIRLYPGISGGGFEENFQSIDSLGAASLLLVADFNLNGRKDFVYSTDNWNYRSNQIGGRTFYYENDGTSTPFSEGPTQEIPLPEGAEELGVPLNDLDTGVAIDYDQDPDGTTDFIVADGNHSGTFFVYANRVQEQYVECGEVDSGVIDIGDQQDEDMVVTAGRLSPDMSLPPGTSVDFYLANEDPPNWTKATPCDGSAGDYCASFDEPTGNELQWKAVMCSDDDRARSPTIRSMDLTYDYALAAIHYRAGVVVDDGVAYAAGFSQPGRRGHFFALDAALTTTYWDAGESIDEMSDGGREIFTMGPDGARLPFSESDAENDALQDALGVASADRARGVIAWARGERFGVREAHRLGAIETSTPAVLSPPSRPVWYPSLNADEKAEVDAFIAAHEDRPTLALFGSRSGKLHAIRSDPTNITGEGSGEEAWAFVPPRVASQLESDRASGTASAYPDGSPRLADIRDEDGDLMTVAVVPSGKGGKGVFALDVTDTVDRVTGEVRGPEPLWEVVPGGSEAGQARASPVIVRTEIGGDERFVAVLGSGIDNDDRDPPHTRGRDLLAVDAATGERLWQLRTACAITSDISGFQRADEPAGDPEADDEAAGFIDRIVVADGCGNVYKADPGVDRGGGYVDTSEFGDIDTGAVDPDGQAIAAVFSTTDTPGALGGDRPIAGTIGVRPDATGRPVLFFGTGGLARFDPSKKNAFYAVYADDGEIRDVQDGECTDEGCEKFYGGVVVSRSQVFVTRSVDPPPGTGLCEDGGSVVEAFDLNTLTSGFRVALDGRSVSPLFGEGGALYATTESGEVTRVGQPSQSAPGDGEEQQTADPAVPTEVLAWRRLF